MASAASSSWFESLMKSRSMAVKVVGFSFFVDYLIVMMVIPLFPVFADDFGLSAGEIGLLFALKPLAQIVTNPFFGILSDNVGRKAPMVCGLFSLAATTILFALSRNFIELAVARALQGVSSAANITAGMAYLADLFPDEKERGVEISKAVIGISMGVFVGPIFGGLMYEVGGLQLPFFIAAGFVLLDGVLRFLLRVEKPFSDINKDQEPTQEQQQPQEQQPQQHGYMRLLRNFRVVVLTMTLVIADGTIGMQETLFALFLDRELHLSPGLVGVVYSTGTILYILLAAPLGAQGSRVGRWKLITLGLLLMAVGISLIPVIESLYWIIPWWMVSSGVGMTCVDVCVNPLMADVVDAYHPGAYGRAFAISHTGLASGFVIGPICGGFLLEATNYQTVTLTFGAVLVAWMPVVVASFHRGVKPTSSGGKSNVIVAMGSTASILDDENDKL